MAKQRKANPCKWKGRYGGKRRAGRRYSRGTPMAGCECEYAFVSVSPQDFTPQQFVFCTNGSEAGQSKLLPDGKAISKRILMAVPCLEVFRTPRSKATKIYRKAVKTRFKGCEPLEQDLLVERLIRYELHETVGLMELIEEGSDDDDARYSPESGNFLGSALERAQFLLKLAMEENTPRPKIETPPIEFDWEDKLNLTPTDLKNRHLMNLYEEGMFHEDRDKRKWKVALLMLQRISDPGDIKKFMPGLTMEEFHSLQSQI